MQNTSSMVFASCLTALLSAGCTSTDAPAACRDPGTLHDEVVNVVAPQYPTESPICFGGGGDCSSLCERLAQDRGTGGRVTVEVCERLLMDGGDVPDDAGYADASGGTIHIVYRTFPFLRNLDHVPATEEARAGFFEWLLGQRRARSRQAGRSCQIGGSYQADAAQPGNAAPVATSNHVTRSLRMCRNIRPLFNFDPPVTPDEVRAASLQFVRKISGFVKPSKANEAAFQSAVDAISDVASELLRNLETASPPKNREEEAAKARARAAVRYGR